MASQCDQLEGEISVVIVFLDGDPHHFLDSGFIQYE